MDIWVVPSLGLWWVYSWGWNWWIRVLAYSSGRFWGFCSTVFQSTCTVWPCRRPHLAFSLARLLPELLFLSSFLSQTLSVVLALTLVLSLVPALMVVLSLNWTFHSLIWSIFIKHLICARCKDTIAKKKIKCHACPHGPYRLVGKIECGQESIKIIPPISI